MLLKQEAVLMLIRLLTRHSRSSRAGSTSLLSPERLQQERDQARVQLQIQHDPALRQALTESELRREQRDARHVRAAQRRADGADQLAAVNRQHRERKLQRELLTRAHADKLWSQRAQSAAQRSLSPAARVAHLARTLTLIRASLIPAALIAVLWGADNVQSTMAAWFHLSSGGPGYWLAYGIEPLVTVPLLVLMWADAVLAPEDDTPETGLEQWSRRGVAGLLLAIAVAMNMLPHTDTGPAALLYGLPPTMLTTIMIVFVYVHRRIGRVLTSLAQHPELGSDTAEVTGHADHAQSAVPDPSTLTGHRSGTELTTIPSQPTGQRAPDTSASSTDRSTARLTGQPDRSAPRPCRDTSSQVTTHVTAGQHLSDSTSPFTPITITAYDTERRSNSGTDVTASGHADHDYAADHETRRLRRVVADRTSYLSYAELIDMFVEPMALKLAEHNDWVSRQDLLNTLGCGAPKGGALLGILNERHPHHPEHQSRRRPERDHEKNEVIRHALQQVQVPATT